MQPSTETMLRYEQRPPHRRDLSLEEATVSNIWKIAAFVEVLEHRHKSGGAVRNPYKKVNKNYIKDETVDLVYLAWGSKLGGNVATVPCRSRLGLPISSEENF